MPFFSKNQKICCGFVQKSFYNLRIKKFVKKAIINNFKLQNATRKILIQTINISEA